MAVEYPYCTVSDVKSYIRNSELADSDYELAISLASRQIDILCGRNFSSHSYLSEFYELDSSNISRDFIYFNFPIKTITALEVSNGLAGDFVLQDTDDYRYIPKSKANRIEESYKVYNLGMRLLDNNENVNRVRVKGQFGFEVKDSSSMPTDLPPSIRRATTILSGVYTNQSRREEVGLDGSRVSLLESEIPNEVYKLIKTNKRVIL